MADAEGRFRGKLQQLCALGRRSQMRLTVEQIKEIMRDEDLTDSQLQLVYSYLDQMSISVCGADEGEGCAAGVEGAAGAEDRRRPLEIYLEELDRITPLPEDMEFGLFEQAAGGDTQAAGLLIERYLQTVCDLAAEYERAHPKLDAEDIVQEANMALVQGVQALEKESTLAAYRARLINSVTSCLDESIRSLEEMFSSDTRVVNRMNQLADMIRDLTEQLGRRPSVDELSAFTELPVQDIRDLLRVGGDNLKITDP